MIRMQNLAKAGKAKGRFLLREIAPSISDFSKTWVRRQATATFHFGFSEPCEHDPQFPNTSDAPFTVRAYLGPIRAARSPELFAKAFQFPDYFASPVSKALNRTSSTLSTGGSLLR